MNSTRLNLIALTASVLTFAAAGSASAHENGHAHEHPSRNPPPEKECKDEYREVPGQGRSCRVEGGLWKVKLRDGSTALTHGTDGPADFGDLGRFSPSATARQPACQNNWFRFRAIIAYPKGTTPNKTAAQFRADLALANGVFRHAAIESGVPGGADLRFMCDSTGQVRVDFVELPTSQDDATFASVVSDLKEAEYSGAAGFEKYAVHYDAPRGDGFSGGQATIRTDSTDSGGNRNNFGESYAVVFDATWPTTLIHEIGHTLGAVQPNAPMATGTGGPNGNGWHCFEGYDVMCYNDGANQDPGTITFNCPDFDHFDCRHDSYFDALIGYGQGGARGSYIDTNWNIGECYVAWVKNTRCEDTTAPRATAPTHLLPQGSQLDATRVPVRLTWTGSDPGAGASGVVGYELWWSVDDGDFSPKLTDVRRNSVDVRLAPGHKYRFAVAAIDAAGNRSTFVYGSAFTLRALQEYSKPIAYQGAWSRYANSSAFGGYASGSTQAGATARLVFSGTHVAWVASKLPSSGRAEVTLDGVPQQTIDLNGSYESRKIVFSRKNLVAGSHELVIKVLAEDPQRPHVNVDAFVVLQ